VRLERDLIIWPEGKVIEGPQRAVERLQRV
jgi:hypothetical protein